MLLTELHNTMDVATTSYALKGLSSAERELLDDAEIAFQCLSEGVPPDFHKSLLSVIKKADLAQAKFDLYKEQGRHVIVCVNRYN